MIPKHPVGRMMWTKDPIDDGVGASRRIFEPSFFPPSLVADGWDGVIFIDYGAGLGLWMG